MALSIRNYSLSLTLIAIFLFSLTSVGIKASVEKKMILGSRPPGCVNKCFNCRPCTATLVIPPHNKHKINNINNSFVKAKSSSLDREDDTYYLVSWKCRCGNKLYQP